MITFYHTCQRCGKSINPDRLIVFPQTRICKNCAEKNGSDMEFEYTKVGMDLDTYKDLLKAVRS